MSHRKVPPDAEDTILDRVVRADGCPSAVAQSRLSDALRDRAEAYRQDAAVDLTIVDALLRLDQAESAAKHLDDHRASLHAMARDLQVVVADAAVEREAERVYEACAHALAPARPPRSGVRRRVVAMAGAAALALALLLPSGRMSPRTTFANLVDGGASLDELTMARERLLAARDRARMLREARADAPRPVRAEPRSHDLVRGKVRDLLAADASGGSAAESVGASATVTSLDAKRAKRRESAEPSADQPKSDPDVVAPVVPIDDDVPDQPKPAEPFKAGASVDPDAATSLGDDAAELPEADADNS